MNRALALLLIIGSVSTTAFAKGQPVTLVVVGAQVIQEAKTVTVPIGTQSTTTCVQLANGVVYGYPQGGGMVQMYGTSTCRTVVPYQYTASGIAQSGYVYGRINGQNLTLYAKPSWGAVMAKRTVTGAAAGMGATSAGDGAQRGRAANEATGDPVGTILNPGTYAGELNGSKLTIHYSEPWGKKEKKATFVVVGTW